MTEFEKQLDDLWRKVAEVETKKAWDKILGTPQEYVTGTPQYLAALNAACTEYGLKELQENAMQLQRVEVVGVRGKDERYHQMKDIHALCDKAGVSLPPEVTEFFGGKHPDEYGEVPLPLSYAWERKVRGEITYLYTLDVEKIPAGVTTVRFLVKTKQPQGVQVADDPAKQYSPTVLPPTVHQDSNAKLVGKVELVECPECRGKPNVFTKVISCLRCKNSGRIAKQPT